MNCPNCKVDIELTWSRYFKNPFGRFVCPACSTRFKFTRTIGYYFWAVSWSSVYLSGTFLLAERNFVIMGVFWVFMMAIYPPIDKALESKLATKLTGSGQ
jgi:hypothetical protein